MEYTITKQERLECIERMFNDGVISERKRNELEYLQEYNEQLINK